MSVCVVCGRSVPEMDLIEETVICPTPECQRFAVNAVAKHRPELSALAYEPFSMTAELEMVYFDQESPQEHYSLRCLRNLQDRWEN